MDEEQIFDEIMRRADAMCTWALRRNKGPTGSLRRVGKTRLKGEVRKEVRQSVSTNYWEGILASAL